MERKKWPEVNELVVCTVSNVVDFGAFVKLDEYEGKEGLIHISEVASGWIKYIRDHVREGQKIVCKVLNVDPTKGHIDLSLKDVNEHQRREKIQEWKNKQKAAKWIQLVAENLKLTPEQKIDLENKLYSIYGNPYLAFEDAALNGVEVLIKQGIEETLAEGIAKIAKENVKIPSVEITGYVDLICPAPNGIDIIKKALKAASKISDNDGKLTITYVGAPRYRIRVIAPDYKKAESVLKKAAHSAIEVVEKNGGSGEFHREIDEKPTRVGI
jgi:translation initiation factor 2 subunit 1